MLSVLSVSRRCLSEVVTLELFTGVVLAAQLGNGGRICSVTPNPFGLDLRG